MTICYFTASGNCLYVARRIGGTLLSVPQLMRQDKIVIEDDAVCIVCPVYAVELPFMIVDFMKKAVIRTDYTRERNDPENRMWRHGIYGNQSKIRSGFL